MESETIMPREDHSNTPAIDPAYVHTTQQQITALYQQCNSIRTRILELCDVAKSLSFDDVQDGRAASPSTPHSQEEIAAQIHRLEGDEIRIADTAYELEEDFWEHWAAHAASRCRALMERVERLPRELRIIVFEALWGDAYHIVTDWNLKALGTQPEDPVALVELWSDRDTGHCFDERFVGSQMLREIVEAWWRMSVFEVKYFGLLPKLLSETFWGEKVNDQVRDVVVPMGYRDERPFRIFRPRITTGANHTDLKNELEPLFDLSKSTRITLKIKKNDRRRLRLTVAQRQSGFLKAVSVLFPGLDRLKKEGYNVMVVVDGDIEIPLASVGLTKEAWRQRVHEAVQAFDDAYRREATAAGIEYPRCWPLTT